jgi:hypothetical protein
VIRSYRSWKRAADGSSHAISGTPAGRKRGILL